MQQRILVWTVVLCTIIILAGAAGASRVAVVINQPQGATYTKCLSVDQSLNAYELLEYTGLDITWSSPGPWGHGLCAIDGTGCPAQNCFCDPENSWRFYLKIWDSNAWTASMKSFDGGGNCDEHYCAQDGDMIGLVYGSDGSEPGSFKYSDICLPITQSDSSKDSEEKTTITSRQTTTSTVPPAPASSLASTTTTQEEASTTTLAVTTTTQRPATTTTEAVTTTTIAPAATTTITEEGPVTSLAEEKTPSIIGNVIAYSVNNSPMIVAFAALFAASYISFGLYKKKTRNKNA